MVSETNSGKMGGLETQGSDPISISYLSSEETLVSDRLSNSHREICMAGMSPYETHPVASKNPLAHPGVLREANPACKHSPPLPEVVVGAR